MTIQVKDQTPRNQYTATSGQTVFPYSFQIFVSGDITVEQNGTILTLATHYTLSGVADIDGGNVTLVTGATTNDIITVYRSMAYSRDTDYQNSGDFLAETVDNDYNRLWLALQQSREGIGRALQYDVTDVFTENLLPVKSARLSRLLGFDSAGEPAMYNFPPDDSGVYAGNLSANGLAGSVPTGWGQGRVSLGYYRLIHNLGTTSYGLAITTEGTETRLNASYEASANEFYVRIYDEATSSLFDSNFGFVLKETI